MERLDKLVAEQGGLTRKQARERIWKGAVSVNGAVEKLIDRKIDPESDEVRLDGAQVSYREHLYIMMNKPQGYVSASRDREEPTVLELLPEEMRRSGLFPAGRLDKDTEGLLIITDDGDFGHRLTAPNKRVYKTYIAQLEQPMPEGAVERFAAGIELADGEVCLPARLETLADGAVRIEICEGKYHQVKRMVAAAGGHVTALRRVAIGCLNLDDALPPGGCRLMDKAELSLALKNERSKT